MYECFACMYVLYHICAWYLWTSEEVIRSPETDVVGGCKSICWCWDLNLGPLKEQQVLLATEPALQTGILFLNKDLVNKLG